jgi:hypothetical protein
MLFMISRKEDLSTFYPFLDKDSAWPITVTWKKVILCPQLVHALTFLGVGGRKAL